MGNEDDRAKREDWKYGTEKHCIMDWGKERKEMLKRRKN
jgi:hypothetical protein